MLVSIFSTPPLESLSCLY